MLENENNSLTTNIIFFSVRLYALFFFLILLVLLFREHIKNNSSLLLSQRDCWNEREISHSDGKKPRQHMVYKFLILKANIYFYFYFYSLRNHSCNIFKRIFLNNWGQLIIFEIRKRSFFLFTVKKLTRK